MSPCHNGTQSAGHHMEKQSSACHSIQLHCAKSWQLLSAKGCLLRLIMVLTDSALIDTGRQNQRHAIKSRQLRLIIPSHCLHVPRPLAGQASLMRRPHRPRVSLMSQRLLSQHL